MNQHSMPKNKRVCLKCNGQLDYYHEANNNDDYYYCTTCYNVHSWTGDKVINEGFEAYPNRNK